MDYFGTPEGQFLTGAHRYLSAARLLRQSKTWRTDAELLQNNNAALVEPRH